jgi:hypothetical protein
MPKVHAFVASALALACGCGDASVTSHTVHVLARSDLAAEPAHDEYGWDAPISAANFGAAADSKLGSAPHALAGHTLRAIVTDPGVRVRGDGKACTACHAWAPAEARADFCARVPAFLAQPTTKGDGRDPEGAKPAIVKELLRRWHDAGCP